MDQTTGEIAAQLIDGSAFDVPSRDALVNSSARLGNLSFSSQSALLDPDLVSFASTYQSDVQVNTQPISDFKSHIDSQLATLPDKLTTFTSAASTASTVNQSIDGFGNANAFFGSLMTEGQLLTADIEQQTALIEQSTSAFSSLETDLDTNVSDLKTDMLTQVDNLLVGATGSDLTRLTALRSDVENVDTLASNQDRVDIADRVLAEQSNSEIESKRDTMTSTVDGLFAEKAKMETYRDALSNVATETQTQIASETSLDLSANDYLVRVADASTMQGIARDSEVERLMEFIATDGFISNLRGTSSET